MKEEPLLLLSDLQKLINQVVLIDYTIIILGGKGMKQVVEVMKYVFAAMGDAIGACPFLSEFRNSFLERPMS